MDAEWTGTAPVVKHAARSDSLRVMATRLSGRHGHWVASVLGPSLAAGVAPQLRTGPAAQVLAFPCFAIGWRKHSDANAAPASAAPASAAPAGVAPAGAAPAGALKYGSYRNESVIGR